MAIVVSRYNASITDPMRTGAENAYAHAGGDPSRLSVIDAPGTFELPALAAKASRSGLFSGVVALGCVIRGETDHDRHIAAAVAASLAHTGADTGVPVAFGVLTVESIEQARARAGGDKGNKGAEAMRAVLGTAAACAAIDAAAASGQIPAAVPLAFETPDKADPQADPQPNSQADRAATSRGAG